jgi:glutathione synthase/RimK-type ligase-like ATP-grasp enzyme
MRQQDALLQPYLPTISSHHERALVFIAGEFSHAVRKMPFMHAGSDVSLRANRAPGATGESPVEATEAEIAVAIRALEASPAGHVFARVDIVNDGWSPRVLEVEMIEPTIYLYACPAAAEKLAEAVTTHAGPIRQ